MRKKGLRRYIALLTAFVFILGSVGMAFADTVYVGNVGFDMDKMLNDDAYNEGFTDYFAANSNDPFIVNMAGMTFDVTSYLNAPEGTSMPDFAASNPADTPAGAVVWDGEGEPGEPVADELTVVEISAIDANTLSVKFTGEGAPAEAVEISLDTALEDGQTEVTFTYNEVEYTGILDEAWVAPVEGELAVLEVSAITKTGVDVEFDALEEDMEDVTIEVKDNNGNVVEVKPLNLVINETEGSFLFETALKSDPTGVWTVAGIEFDCDVAAKLGAINNAGSELALYNALTAAGIKNLEVANSSLYFSKLPSEDFETLAEVQEYVDGVNADVVSDEGYADQIETLADALTANSEVQVLNALAVWEQINEDFVAAYMAALNAMNTGSGPDTTALDPSAEFEAVQDEIDTVNVAQVGMLVTTAQGSADRDDYDDAVAAMQYVREDDPEDDTDTVKADMQAALDELNLVINVLEAKTAAQFTNAYNALVAFVDDETVIGDEEYYIDLRTKYMEEVETLTSGSRDATNIEGAILKVNTQKRAELFNDVANVDDTPGATQTKTADVLKKLQALAAFVPDETDFDIDTVVDTDTRLAAYRANFDSNLIAIADVTDYANTASPANVKAKTQGVQTQVTNANNAAVSTPLAEIAKGTGNADPNDDGYTTADDLLALLKGKELGLGNIIDANKDAYFAEESSISTAAGVDKDTLKDLITDLNQVQIVAKAKTGAEARPGLAHIAIVESTTTFINLTAVQKSEVSALFIDDDKFGLTAFAGATRQVSKLKDYTNTGDVDTDLAAIVTAYGSALGGVNTAANIGAMVTALEALEYDAFDDLTAAEKIDVADYFLDNFPMDKTPAKIDYTTFAGIQTDIDAAIAAVK